MKTANQGPRKSLMGLMNLFRPRREPFVGITSADLGVGLLELAETFHDAILGQSSSIMQASGMVVCRSPVLIVRDGKVLQPASVVPAPMLTRFWTGRGHEILKGTELASVIDVLAPHFAASNELARTALSDVYRIFISEGAPTSPWPVQDRRLQLVSLLLTDCVRKLSAGFSDKELFASYGLLSSTDHDEAARRRYETMSAEENAWLQAAVVR